MPEECGLDERRGRDPARDRLRLQRVGGARDGDLGEDGHPLAVGDDLAREIVTDLVQRCGEGGVRLPRPCDPARAVREQEHGVVRRAVAVDRDRVERLVDGGPQELDRLARRERVVGRDEGEHRRKVGMDHPRALRHTSEREALARDDRLLRARVGGHDRVRGILAALGRERLDRRLQPRQQLRHRQRDADHAGREDEHLLGRELEQPPGLGRGRQGVDLPALAGRRVGDARVDDDGLRICELEVLAVHEQARRLHLVAAEHPGADRRLRRAHDGEIALHAPDPAVDPARGEALRRGHAHTSTPESRSPSVSSSPSTRFAFWIA